jgi:hypothetical protein
MGFTCHICNKAARFQTPTGRWVCLDCYRNQFNNIREDTSRKAPPKKVVEKPKEVEVVQENETQEEETTEEM